ncbi:putative trans-sialidase [Trypanosoma cruzi]|nr:putative trans-sialidase [Trypanosoma cruzi]
MSRRVFASAVLLLLVFLMMCCGSGAAQVVVEEPSSDPQFEWKDIKDGDGVTVESLGAPSLLKVGSDVFAVAEVQCKKSGENDVFTGIASQIITTQTANTPVEALKDYKDKKQFLEDGSEDPKKKVDVSRPTTVVKGSDIYMLLGKYSRSSSDIPEEDDAGNWGLLLVRGEVGGKAGNKQIDWKETTDSSRAYFGKELQPLKRLIGGGGSGVKMNDGTLVFPVEATKKKKEKDEKTISLIIHNLAATPSWKLSKGMSADDCSDPSVVEWKDKKLMMMTACDGRRRVYESADKGDSWTEELGTLSRVWGSKKGVRSGFITARIDGDGDDNRNVMLVTLPVYAKTESEEKEKEKEKGELHLWLTDNTHIADIGAVSVEGDDVAASSLLYKSGKSGESETNGKEELIALYEKKGGGDTPSLGMVSVPLTAQLQRVKEVLKTWNKVDSRVSHLCPSESALQDPSADTACSAVKITDGLVGFLSGSFSDSTWRDEYLGVNAKMKGNDVGKAAAESTRTSDGVTFHGAWAEWPVGAQGENQLYHFANYKFTLVATVSIDKVPEGHTPIPLMGVQMNYNENTVLLGLSYNNNKEKKWMLQCGGGTKSEELSRTGEPGTKRHVVILLRNGNQGTAYVDGQRVGAQCALGSTETQEISHFYIGGDGRSAVGQGDVSVTVTNVLLYNRPLSSKEITALDTIKLSISQTAKEGETEEGTALDGGAHGDASNHCGSGLLPSLLLLLGLWWFAAL